MKDYWLAKLISSIQKVDSRKRLQKSIYLLQIAGCPLKCDYLLHYYGPYSFELASLIEQLDGAQIIAESPEPLASGVIGYASNITQKGTKVIRSFENTSNGQRIFHEIEPFIQQFQSLSQERSWILELAATVAYFYEGNWKDAKDKTATFKRIQTQDQNLSQAVKLAKRYVNTN
jgi:uncharacterized protein YwgA